MHTQTYLRPVWFEFMASLCVFKGFWKLSDSSICCRAIVEEKVIVPVEADGFSVALNGLEEVTLLCRHVNHFCGRWGGGAGWGEIDNRNALVTWWANLLETKTCCISLVDKTWHYPSHQNTLLKYHWNMLRWTPTHTRWRCLSPGADNLPQEELAFQAWPLTVCGTDMAVFTHSERYVKERLSLATTHPPTNMWRRP